jgi:predicted ATPase/DNA-binding SARP family transcriptional activator
VVRVLFRVLGPVDVLDGGAPVRLGGSEQRRLLAALLAHGGEPMPTAALVDLLWGALPPPGAERLLLARVSTLRRALGRRSSDSAPATLRSTPSGHLLQVARDDCDATRFEGLVDRGRAVLGGGDPRGALRLLQEALGLWRGRAFQGVELDASGRAVADRLEEERLTAWELRAAAELGLGRHEELVGPLAALVEAHPDRERLAEQLVLASYRTTGRDGALAAWQRVSDLTAAADLAGPGPRLRALRRRILAEDPSLRDRARVAVGRGDGLPAPTTSFVGRDGELALLLGALRRSRLVTLTGPGGVGKTRLAVELARLLRATTPGVVALVDLSRAGAEQDLLTAVTTALGGKEGISDDLLTIVSLAVGSAPSLLVLDSCEHLVDACARVVPRLLGSCPELRVVTTSRVSLDVAAEAVYVVRPLRLPDAEPGPPGVEVSPAVQLFWERATAVRPTLEPDEETRRAVEEICRRVDGLPLAVELAASLVRTMTPEAIAAHQRRRRTLPDPLAGDAGAEQRERRATLSGLVEWSAELLSPDARRLLDGLSVFSGGFSAEAADAVLPGDPSGLAPLHHLVRASLVNVEHGEDGARYRLLETVRSFAAARLEESGEAQSWKDRHAGYFLELAETAGRHLKGADQAVWLQTLRREEDNLRAALAHLAARPDAAERECRLAVALWRPCYLSGQYTQGRAWLRHALQHTQVEPALRAAVLSACGALALYQCDYRPARRYCERAARLYAETGDAVGRAEALTLLGSIAREQADYAQALRLHAEAAEAFRAVGDRWGVAHSLELEAFARWLSGDLDGSALAATEARRLARDVGDDERAAWTQIDLGAVALFRGDLASAGALLGDALAAFDALGFTEGQGWSHNLLAVRSAELGEHAAALVSLGLALRMHRDVGDRWRICSVLEAVVRSAAALGMAAQAAPLLGMTDRLREELGTPVPPSERRAHADALQTVRAQLGEARLARARRRGETWSLDRACNEALALGVRDRAGSGALAGG